MQPYTLVSKWRRCSEEACFQVCPCGSIKYQVGRPRARQRLCPCCSIFSHFLCYSPEQLSSITPYLPYSQGMHHEKILARTAKWARFDILTVGVINGIKLFFLLLRDVTASKCQSRGSKYPRVIFCITENVPVPAELYWQQLRRPTSHYLALRDRTLTTHYTLRSLRKLKIQHYHICLLSWENIKLDCMLQKEMLSGIIGAGQWRALWATSCMFFAPRIFANFELYILINETF